MRVKEIKTITWLTARRCKQNIVELFQQQRLHIIAFVNKLVSSHKFVRQQQIDSALMLISTKTKASGSWRWGQLTFDSGPWICKKRRQNPLWFPQSQSLCDLVPSAPPCSLEDLSKDWGSSHSGWQEYCRIWQNSIRPVVD